MTPDPLFYAQIKKIGTTSLHSIEIALLNINYAFILKAKAHFCTSIVHKKLIGFYTPWVGE